MIDPKSLRIGNWVEYLGKQFPCDINTIYAISMIEGPSEMYKPIPLTPEILEKCGFENQHGYSDTFIIKDKGYPLDPYAAVGNFCVFLENGIAQIGCGYQNAENKIGLEFKYLHQLQNIIYILTGEELEYKP